VIADVVRRRVLQPLLRSLGLAHAGHHAFRHGVPRMLAERGVSGAVIQQVMRHGTLAQTEQYLHVEARDLWANLEKAGLAGTKKAA
jgi:site-specific recombinase XerD